MIQSAPFFRYAVTDSLHMAQTNAQRQRAYRQRHLSDVEGSRARLNIVCDQRAALALRRLAAHKGMTQAAMLERLILDADARATVKMSAATWDAYHAIK